VRVDATLVERDVMSWFWEHAESDLVAQDMTASATDLTALERSLERAEQQLAQWISPEVQATIGDLSEYTTGLRQRREARDEAARSLGAARAALPVVPLRDVESLRSKWESKSTAERREILGEVLHVLALHRDMRLVVCPPGVEVGNLPKRGFKRAPKLGPFPDEPPGSWILLLEPALKDAGNGASSVSGDRVADD
jgi:hypothetical protein